MKFPPPFRVWMPACLSVIAIAAGLRVYPDFLVSVRCACIEPLKAPELSTGKLLPCSNLNQRIDWANSSNIARNPGNDDGWETLSPADPQLPAMLSVVVVRDRDEAVWFPRLSGKESSISLLSDERRQIDHIGGAEGWTPIGAKRTLFLRCLHYGHAGNADVPERVLIRLIGKWTQIWSKQGMVFF